MSGQLVENTIPVLAVSNVAASIRFYCQVLGFELDWGGSGDMPDIASVSRDGHGIMLQQRGPVEPGCVWIGGPGLIWIWDKVHLNGGVTVVQRPTNQPWALEMKITDPDGNILWFGMDPLPDAAFGSELDNEQLSKLRGQGDS